MVQDALLAINIFRCFRASKKLSNRSIKHCQPQVPMKLKVVIVGCPIIMLGLLQTIHSIKLVRFETNLSREMLNHQYVRKQEYFNTKNPAGISKYRTSNDQSSLHSSVRIIDLSSTSVTFSYPDISLYIDEGDGLSS